MMGKQMSEAIEVGWGGEVASAYVLKANANERGDSDEASEVRRKPTGDANLDCENQAVDIVAASFTFKIFLQLAT